MILKESEGIQWLEFELFAECKKLKHATFLRHGGTSHGAFASLNLGKYTEDSPTSLFSNHQKIIDIFNLESICCLKQIHGTEIWEAADRDQEGDGLITNKKKVGIMITHADCQAALFYDPILHVAAVVHAGWRGQRDNIYGVALKKLQTIYGTKPSNLLVGISPSLGPNAFEFKNWESQIPHSFQKYQVRKNYFNFWKIAKDQLLEEGILPDHLQIAHMCTFESNHDFFSHRKGDLGRNGTLISLL